MIKDDKPIEEVIKYKASCSMVEPTMFTDEEISKMNANGINGLNEMMNKYSSYRKNKEQKKSFLKNKMKLLKTSLERRIKLKENQKSKKRSEKIPL